MNGVIIQYFHWYHKGELWKEFIENAETLKNLGFTAVWFPPAVKCDLGTEGRGYDVYDLYDLGEFNQKGSMPTRYGTKSDYLAAINMAHMFGLQVYADIVLNHRMGADEFEEVTVHQVNSENRTEVISEDFPASAQTRFTFPGRNGKYSQFVWDQQCFSGVDRIRVDDEEKAGIFKIINNVSREWDDAVSHQLGNYDYLMGADVDFRNPEVVEELKKWIRWYLDTTKVDGLRLDALKHISSHFIKEYIDFIRSEIDGDFFFVGEYWKDNAEPINAYLDVMEHSLSLFDVPLHYHFFEASRQKAAYDLRFIFKNTLSELNLLKAVSFVGNHDTQRLQSLESTVEDWFRPLAYAMILLSENSYPCVFYPDLFGAEYVDTDLTGVEVKVTMPKVEILPKLLQARQKFGYGEQINYFDDANCIAWVRTGTDRRPGCVVVISNSTEAHKEIELGPENADCRFTDFLEIRNEEIVLDQDGKGIFPVNASSVSIWVKAEV